MNYYHMWCNLRESHRDLEFAGHVRAYLDHLQHSGRIEGWSLTRRKFGFGPDALGEFHITVRARDLAQLDEAFNLVATRTGEVERLHRPVYAMVTDFRSALERDFPIRSASPPDRPHRRRRRSAPASVSTGSAPGAGIGASSDSTVPLPTAPG